MGKAIKKPYEISLWGEQLIWVRQLLDEVQVLKEDYSPGKYYSQNNGAYGDIPFTLDYNEYNDGQRYYIFRAPVKEGPDRNVIEGEGPEDVEALEEWRCADAQKMVCNVTEFDSNITYYTYSNENGAYVEVSLIDTPKPESDVIYFRDEANKYRPNAIASYYKEYKLCIIGSNTMDAPFRAVNGKFVTKINGENTLTFSVYYKYTDPASGKLLTNPFLPYLENERKVKLRIGEPGAEDCQWYDLVVKQIQENSETKAFQYTCKDQFVNELSKSGFELEFDNERENNMGTIVTLGNNILEGSDWRVGEGNSILYQYVEEPLYEVKLKKTVESLSAIDMLKPQEPAISIPGGSTILVFYSHINECQTNLQFLYSPRDPDGLNDPYRTDDDLIIDKELHPNYIIKDVKFEGGRPEWAESCIISKSYRGMRLVRQAQSKYDSTIDKYVSVYEKGGEIYYGFTKNEYLSPQAVFNHIVNPNSFTSTNGWIAEKIGEDRSTLSIVTYPQIGSFSLAEGEKWGAGLGQIKTYLSYTNIPEARIMNTSISNHRSAVGSLIKGDKWVVRLKYRVDSVLGEYNRSSPTISLTKYTLNPNGSFGIEEGDVLANFHQDLELEELVPNDLDENGKVFDDQALNPKKTDYIYLLGTIFQDVSEEQMLNYNNRFGLFISHRQSNNTYFIEDIELFPMVTYFKDGQHRLCVPGGEFFSEARTDYYYYKPSENIKDIKDLTYESVSKGAPDSNFTQIYNDGEYTKVRSITGKESNRFNLLQDLCEKFQCWISYDVKRNSETGEILLGQGLNCLEGDEAFRQQKFIVFKEYLSDEYNWAGFRYGVNEKSIQRTIDSNQIVSKMIVKNNANEFADNGFCSIARAEDNDIKENFLLNFDHYYRHNLLELATVTNDLYLDSDGYIGYYKLLREKNLTRDAKIEQQANLLIDMAHYDSMVQTYKTSYNAAIEEKYNIENYIFELTGSTFDTIATNFKWSRQSHNGLGYFDPQVIYYEQDPKTGAYFRTEDSTPDDSKYYATNEIYSKWESTKEFVSYWAKYCQVCNIIAQHGPIYENAERQLAQVTAEYNAISAELEELRKEKIGLNLQFYKKYSRFLQEGSWISEDYVDDNLYYLDAKSTLHTSAKPKVTYNISVLELSQLPGYENYKFKLGDRTYIEDIEFFGYSLKDGTTPHREEIVVSEISLELDAPEKSSIKVQNYKTQFDDLFSRITASTQQAEYHSGEYQRAANLVEEDGTISADSIEKAFQKNAISLSNAKDQSVVIDNYGITTSSLSAPDQLVRIISGGIYISKDGGETWRTGITGSGVNTSVLTSGQLNTEEVLITSGNSPSFRWNAQGINAFFINPKDGAYDPTKFVRFDQYGIYGLDGSPHHKFDVTEANEKDLVGEERIWDEAQYALTWKGFMLKRKGTDGGYVSISSEDDFVVHDGTYQRIKIGAIGEKANEDGTSSSIYGIRIGDAEGNSVMETNDDGSLWLKQWLNVETYGMNKKVAIGKLDTEDTKDSEHGGRVIDANGNFVVYDDGFMRATGAYFDGEINATDGYINNVEVTRVSNIVSQVSTTIDNTTLTFSANGLTLGAGDLVIQKITFEELVGGFEEGVQYYVKNDSGYKKSYDKAPVEGVTYYYSSGTKVFHADKDGNLIISGTVEATGGKIGGLELNGNVLYGSGHENFYLDGANGELGIDTAYVYDKIYLQETKNDDTSLRMVLKRPTMDDPTVLSTAGINLAADGAMTLGNTEAGYEKGLIVISAQNGGDPYIGHMKKDKDGRLAPGGWAISGTGHASFQDITADNLHILNSTLEIGNVQAVGGIMVFKDAFTVEQVKYDDDNKAYLLVDGFATFENDSIIYVGNSSLATGLDLKEYYKVERVAYSTVNDEDPIFEPQKDIMSGHSKMRIYLKDDAAKDFGPNIVFNRIGPNKSNILYAMGYDQRQNLGDYVTQQKNYDFAFGNAFGITEIELNEQNGQEIKYTPRLVMGDLHGVSTALGLPIKGYGLYCDNVWLNGGLVAVDDSYTAGVRSNAPQEILLNTGSDGQIADKVVIWAGAKKADSQNSFEDSIANANFLVTQSGYVRTSLGEFSKGIISDSEIRGGNIYSSNLYTANIYGYNKDEQVEAGLNIYDLDHGVAFKETSGGVIQEVFSMGNQGFFAGNAKNTRPFIGFSNDFNGAEFWASDKTDNSAGTAFTAKGPERFNKDGLKVSSIEMQENGEIHFTKLTDTYASLSATRVSFHAPVVYENNKGYLQYSANEEQGGYDLYVFFEQEQ